MVDTTYAYTPGAGATAAIDRISSTDYPYYKVKWGLPGTVTDVDVSSGKPLPIQLRGSDGTDVSKLLPVTVSSGNIAVTNTPAVTVSSGAVTVSQPTAANLNVHIDPTQVTAPGLATPANSQPVVQTGYTYKACPVNVTTTLGTTGSALDYLLGVLVIPTNTSPTAITIVDNVTNNIVFAGGVNSVTTLIPFFIPWGAFPAASGPWKITCGATGVSAVAIGKFT